MKAPFNQMQFRFADELIIDSFAGGGGASTGIEWAFNRPVDIAINHNAEAIRMHEVNHPHTKHYCESIWQVDPLEATKGQPVALAWFSPDCTHFSKAKGGKPVKKQIRGLAWIVLRWAAKAKPRIICLENVEEFETWGPLTRKRGRNKHPKPCPMRKSQTFIRWIAQLEALGYQVEKKKLKACDFGAPTTRERLFIIARRDGEPIVWPEPTHGPGREYPYRTAAECIDWDIHCPSIFLTKKEVKEQGLKCKRPLVDSTMRRIGKGIWRYVINSADPFVVPEINIAPSLIAIDHKGGNGSYANSIKEPIRTITTENRYALVSAFLTKFRTGATGSDMKEPMHTITAGGANPKRPAGAGHAMGIVTSNLMKLRGIADERDSFQSMDSPTPTITANGTHLAEVQAFLIKYYGTDQDPRLTEPLHTLTTKPRFGLVTVHGEEYQIVDVGMRMLMPRELYRAQGFPDDYIIDIQFNGKPLSKSSQVRMVGNSVSPCVAQAIVAANAGVEAKEQAA